MTAPSPAPSSTGSDPVDDEEPQGRRLITRRRLLVAGGVMGVGAVGAAVVVKRSQRIEIPGRIRRLWEGDGPTANIPDAGAGEVSYEVRASEARGRDVGFFTAVPDGYGDGDGLPVCLVLHGASARADDFEGFGLPNFLTAVVDAGAPPFVLVGADGGPNRWQAVGDDDPQRMLREEVPAWCEERGWDTSRMAAHGWSMGGYGALLAAALEPDWLRSVAVLSPALGGGQLAPLVGDLDGDRLALWCGTSDSAYDGAAAFADAVPGGPAFVEFTPEGRHTREYWNSVTEPALAFVAESLA